MPIQAFTFEIKSVSETGQFSGLASTYGNRDLGGDVVMPGAFTKTLQTNAERPLLMAHRDPIGLVKLTDSADGLLAEGQLSLGLQLGKDAYTLLKDRVIRGLSIGYQTIKDQIVGDVRQLLELKLFEVSLTPFPLNEEARITEVKNMDEVRNALASFQSDFARAIKESRWQYGDPAVY
jgi:HK97 family phage prohead protease